MDFSEALAHLSQVDTRFAALAAEHGTPEWQPHANYLQALSRAIIYQQLSGKAAGTIYNRFIGLYNGTFPTATQLLETEHSTLRSVGLSNSKALYLKNLNTAFTNGSIETAQLPMLSDAEISKKLTAIKGIGQWTVDIFLMSTLGRPNILAVGDLGIRKGMQRFYQLETLPTPTVMQQHASAWEPWRSLGCWYMWRVAHAPL